MRHYNLAHKFYLNAGQNPDRIALVIGDTEYCYEDLAGRAQALAMLLCKEYPEPEARVGILASRSIEAYVGLLASAWAGRTYVPLNPAFPTAYLKNLISRTGIKVLIVDHAAEILLASDRSLAEGIRTINPSSMPTVTITQGEDNFRGGKDFPPVEISADDILYIMFTSGTTGEPKMIGATGANVAHFLEASQNRYRLNRDDRLSQFNDLGWDPSVFDMFAAWAVGASVHVVPEAQLLAPAHFIKKHRLTVWYSTPSQIDILARMNLLKPGSFPSLRLSLFVGEPLAANKARQWMAAAARGLVENVYGPTETTVVCMGQAYEPDRPEVITPKRGYVAIGEPYRGVLVAIIDKRHQFLGVGEVGELVIGGPTVAPGYLDNPGLTAQKFVVLNHPQLGESTWYLTGDRGYQDKSGIFHFLGRADNQVQVFGKRVELEEVEFHLRQVGECEESVVLAWPVKDGSAQGLVGFVSGTKYDAMHVKRELQSILPQYMVPRTIKILSEMPRNRNGKVDRKSLLKLIDAIP